MKKVVFFKDIDKLSDALDNFDIKSFSGKKVPLKLHMGEKNNKYFPPADFVKKVVDDLKKFDVDPFLFDTTVAYRAMRKSKRGYYKIAKLHGFEKEKIGCDVVIDSRGVNVEIEGRKYEVAKHIKKSSHIFALSHVKGHVATGFGGAIKNLGMGGVTKKTKKHIHNGGRPVHNKDKCTYCGACAEVCPFNVITVKDSSWKFNKRECFGCGLCVESCNYEALDNAEVELQYSLACSVKACVEGKNVIYLNELKRISRSCDCDPGSGPIICPDIGYLVSDDPVAVDQASLDLVNKVKEDIFLKENKIDPYKQVKYGEEIGLGSTSYQLVEI